MTDQNTSRAFTVQWVEEPVTTIDIYFAFGADHSFAARTQI